MSQTATLAVGDAAPEFALRRNFQETISLEELRGRGPVVVVFYVFDFGEI